MINRKDIQIRDPFVYVDGGRYILLGTTDANCWKGNPVGFGAYTSHDLEEFEPAGMLFTPSPDFWGTENFWAPELHCFDGEYYLFASFIAPGRMRATAILKADNPLGPFHPWGEDQLTPRDWMCLDGTLYVDSAGEPWVVFCHEWVQQGGGTICARRLKRDLSGAEGDPITLFSATDAPWAKQVRHSSGVVGTVTDGPFMVPSGGRALWMLWSSLGADGYAIGLASSESGDIRGPWVQREQPLFAGDGGHGMVFHDLAGDLRLAIHTPNKTPNERPIFPRVKRTGDGLAF